MADPAPPHRVAGRFEAYESGCANALVALASQRVGPVIAEINIEEDAA